MSILAAINISDYLGFLNEQSSRDMFFAILTIFIGVIVAKIIGKIAVKLNERFAIENTKAISSFARLLELFVVIIFLIVSLGYLHVDPATIILAKLFSLIPDLIILILLIFLGIIIINIVIEIIKSTVLKIGFGGYLDEMGISEGVVSNIFVLVKVLLFLIVLSASLTYVGLSLPFVDSILIAFIYGFMAFAVITAIYVLKDPLSNFFSGWYIEKNLLKPGQFVRVEGFLGEVVSVSSHGTTIKLPSGYNVLIPNREVLAKNMFIKRATIDIEKLETIRNKFTAQLRSYCGPASGQMMLSFFGYDVDQKEIGNISKTKTPGGTGPKKLIEAIRAVTDSSVRGALIKADEIVDLKEEIKGWLSEGALLIMWFKKSILFKKSKTKGHYVLCVGIEGDEAIILDPSRVTAGVYMIDYRLLEEAMSEHDKKRGYLVFANKGTPAYWRITEGLIYSDTSSYKEVSKTFERHLKKLLRQNAAINNLLSEYVFKAITPDLKGVKRIWKPSELPELEKKEGKKSD